MSKTVGGIPSPFNLSSPLQVSLFSREPELRPTCQRKQPQSTVPKGPAFRLIRLGDIVDHPMPHSVLFPLGLYPAWATPANCLSELGVHQLSLVLPIHVVSQGGKYHCFGGIRVLHEARRQMSASTKINVLLHSEIDPAVPLVEMIILAIWYRLDRGDLTRLIRALKDIGSSELLAGRITKVAISEWVKRSWSSLRDDHQPKPLA